MSVRVAAACLLCVRLAVQPAWAASEHYLATDFARVAKIDAHVHANSDELDFLNVAVADGFQLLSINVDYPDFPPLPRQAEIAHRLRAVDPRHFFFATTFSMRGFGTPGWVAETLRGVAAEVAQGALAVKIWKNVGMIERDPSGRLIRLDDARFDPVVRYLLRRRLPLVLHQAEPKNCWLPLDQMTTDNDRSYFREHPEYYMYLHPELPSYESLLSAQDRFVTRYPALSVVGAHLASLEWSVAEVGRFLDTHPRATVDLAARMTQVQFQSRRNLAAVRRFFIRYQDRILYGSDLTAEPRPASAVPDGPAAIAAEADAFWRSDWLYLATSDTQYIQDLGADVAGLALPKAVIRKIYHDNAVRVYRIDGRQPRQVGGLLDPH